MPDTLKGCSCSQSSPEPAVSSGLWLGIRTAARTEAYPGARLAHGHTCIPKALCDNSMVCRVASDCCCSHVEKSLHASGVLAALPWKLMLLTRGNTANMAIQCRTPQLDMKTHDALRSAVDLPAVAWKALLHHAHEARVQSTIPINSMASVTGLYSRLCPIADPEQF